MKNQKEISEDEYNFMRASGTQPGILYGLPNLYFSSAFDRVNHGGLLYSHVGYRTLLLAALYFVSCWNFCS